jgi:hypothetical protein
MRDSSSVDIKDLCDEAFNIDAAMVAHGIEAARKHNERLNTIVEQANRLMDSGPSVNPVITNADVVEALIADIRMVEMDKEPTELGKLIELDS